MLCVSPQPPASDLELEGEDLALLARFDPSHRCVCWTYGAPGVTTVHHVFANGTQQTRVRTPAAAQMPIDTVFLNTWEAGGMRFNRACTVLPNAVSETTGMVDLTDGGGESTRLTGFPRPAPPPQSPPAPLNTTSPAATIAHPPPVAPAVPSPPSWEAEAAPPLRGSVVGQSGAHRDLTAAREAMAHYRREVETERLRQLNQDRTQRKVEAKAERHRQFRDDIRRRAEEVEGEEEDIAAKDVAAAAIVRPAYPPAAVHSPDVR